MLKEVVVFYDIIIFIFVCMFINICAFTSAVYCTTFFNHFEL